jgi:hypothetical protein
MPSCLATVALTLSPAYAHLVTDTIPSDLTTTTSFAIQQLFNSINTRCSKGSFELPRLGSRPSSRSHRMFVAPTSLSTETISSSTPHFTHHTPSWMITTPTKSYQPNATYTSHSTALPKPSHSPNSYTQGEPRDLEPIGAIPGLWIGVALSVAVFLGWMGWEIWRDVIETMWRKRHLENEPLLRSGKLRGEDVEAGDVRRR